MAGCRCTFESAKSAAVLQIRVRSDLQQPHGDCCVTSCTGRMQCGAAVDGVAAVDTGALLDEPFDGNERTRVSAHVKAGAPMTVDAVDWHAAAPEILMAQMQPFSECSLGRFGQGQGSSGLRRLVWRWPALGSGIP